ncbi:MAG: carboxymethylenebutenolidase [Curvibacter sp. RIFCSPHIGHO2_12_FULL_63_18]|uniref:dienelactone hydrolase family protein n=1 Tax=Rhodoferax sp. TaxID=50421 RepID=UPI0008CCF8A1|nr:dienelactone hydrolase family protein [Rhodoferax sp.]OGO99839.1 MAG: carboxymethylenebutenolidase [Curvibacter sp. GWA2_63_95]OGP06573.1 MAG: carboxymethylenebutenolidase [Curvibacter sp. RIFCSPHIGHO2_12_FULL_63_18]HCX82474.1 carboxymethylenebutenolidase [Rhodoferax sp.]
MFDALKSQVNSLLPGSSTEAGATRRTALKTALGVGYAATAMPIMAQTAIKTPATGLAAGEGIFDVDGSTVPFYYAAPEGKKNLPIVLVVQEIFGVHEYIADTCRRFAKAGYLAIAPDLYARQGDAAKYTDIGKLLAEVVSKVPDDQVMGDLDAAVAWAGENGGNVKKVAVTGFCWGGRITWLYAAHSKNVKAGVAWYGRLVGASNAVNPKHPLELAASLKAPVLGLYGGQDGGIPLTTVNEMKEALAAAKGNAAAQASEFVVYPQAPHAFHADYRPSYRKDAAEDGFARTLAWFKTKGMA